jgi:hypothetical protein
MAVMLIRSIWTFPAFDPDALTKYFFAAEINRTGDWRLLLYNHHTMRWVEMVPQVWLTALLGGRYEVFYILPLLIWALGFVALLRAMRSNLSGTWLLLLGALLFVEPLGFRTSSQLLNPPFGILFTALGIAALVHAKRRNHAIVATSALLFFLGYGAHVTYLAFALGAFLWLLAVQKEPDKALLFVVCLVLLIAVEMLVFNGLSDWTYVFGRWEGLLSSPHMARAAQAGNEVGALDLLSRWINIPHFDKALTGAFLFSIVWFLRNQRWRQAPGYVVCAGLSALSYALFITFAVVDLDPIRPLVILTPRYLTPFFPFASVVAVYTLSRQFAQKSNSLDWLWATVAATLLAVLLVAPHWYNRPSHSLVVIRPFAFVWSAHEEFTRLAEDFRDGHIILRGRPHAYKLIPTFLFPITLVNSEEQVSSVNVRTDAQCVSRLDQVPLRLNYRPCD